MFGHPLYQEKMTYGPNGCCLKAEKGSNKTARENTYLLTWPNPHFLVSQWTSRNMFAANMDTQKSGYVSKGNPTHCGGAFLLVPLFTNLRKVPYKSQKYNHTTKKQHTHTQASAQHTCKGQKLHS